MSRRVLKQIDEMATNNIPTWVLIAALFVVPIATFIIDKGGALLARNEAIATKPYVDDKAAEVTAAAKIREQALFEKAVEHSDRNHDDMVLRMKDIASDTRALGLKIDSIHDQIQVQSDTYSKDRNRKH